MASMSMSSRSSLIDETPVDSCDYCNKPVPDYLKHLLDDHNFSIDKARQAIQAAFNNGQDHEEPARRQQGNKENREELLVNGVPIAVPKSTGIIIINAGGGDGGGDGCRVASSSSAGPSIKQSKVVKSSKTLAARPSAPQNAPNPGPTPSRSPDPGSVEEAFDAWCAGRCSYRCPTQFCNKEFNESSAFWRHVRLSHGQSSQRFKADNEEDSYVVAKDFMQCKLCKQQVTLVLHLLSS